MSDLVKRLQKAAKFGGHYAEAATEIERLQHEIDVQCSSEYVEKILKRNELLEKVAEAADKLRISEFRAFHATGGYTIEAQELMTALATLKTDRR